MKKWQRIRRELQAVPLPQAARLLTLRLSRPWRHRRGLERALRQIASFQADLAVELSPGARLEEFLVAKFRDLNGFPISAAGCDQVAEVIRSRFPQWQERCLLRAEEICRNEVHILGRRYSLGPRIPWRTDMCSGATWPFGPRDGAEIGPDIKFIWELSRFHHGVTLGRAYALTGDDRYAAKWVELFLDWHRNEGQGEGPNWDCPMEVAIRAVNLIWTSALVSSSPAFNLEVRKTLVASLLGHASFIYHQREYDERVVGRTLVPINGNHYLSNLAGLLFITFALPEFRCTQKWREFALKEFWRELDAQVDGDGVNWEYSPNYHRLVLEMVLSSLVLLERNQIQAPPEIREKVVRMLDFAQHYRTNFGSVSHVRDIDNGRFCILGADELDSHDHVLDLGKAAYPDQRLRSVDRHEDTLWHLEAKATALAEEQRPQTEPGLGSRLFRESGFGILRAGDLHLLAVCCPKGMKGYCGHTHNDFLSFELSGFGRPLLVDSGSFVYSQNADWRNKFRATASHNTLQIDGAEQNRIVRWEPFEIGAESRPTVRDWRSSATQDVLDADYELVLPDGTKVTHSRRFVFLKEEGVYLIHDWVTGQGTHRIETSFHLAPGMDIARAESQRFFASYPAGPGLEVEQIGSPSLDLRKETGWVSAIYAQKEPGAVMVWHGTVPLPYSRWFIIKPLPKNGASAVSSRDLAAWIQNQPLTPPVAT